MVTYSPFNDIVEGYVRCIALATWHSLFIPKVPRQRHAAHPFVGVNILDGWSSEPGASLSPRGWLLENMRDIGEPSISCAHLLRVITMTTGRNKR